MARFLRTETNSSGGHSRLRPPAVVVEIPPVVVLPRGIEGSLAPIDSGRRVYAHSKLGPPTVVGAAPTAVYSGPHVTLAAPQPRRKAKSRLLPVPAAFRPVGQLVVTLAPSFSVRGSSRTAKSRLTQVVYGGTSGPPIRGYLTPPLDRVPISNSRLRPPAVVNAAVVATFYGPAVTLAPSRRPVAKSRLRPVPAAFRPVGQLAVHLAPSRRPIAKSRLSAPTVVNPIQELLPRPHEGYLAPLRDWRRVYAHSFLRPPILTVAVAAALYPINVTLAPSRRPVTKSLLRGPVRATDLAVPSTVTLFPLLGRVPAVHSRLRPPETPVQKPYAPTLVVLAPSRRPIAKSRLLPVPAAFRPVGVLKVTLTNQRRVKAKSFLRPPVRPTDLAIPSTVTLFPLTNRVPAVHSRLRPPATLQVVVAVAYYGPAVTLAPSRRPVAKSRLLPVPSAFQPVGLLRVYLAPSTRGAPKSRLEPPTVVGPVLARPIAVTLAPSRRPVTKSRLRPPTDLVDQADVGTLRVHLTYSRRGTPKSILHPPVPPETFRGLQVHLAPSSRGKPRSFFIRTPIARQAVELSGPRVTLVRIRPPRTKSRLPQASLYQAQPKAERDLRVTLAYQSRGKPKSKLKPPTVVRAATPYFRDLPITLAPQARGKAKSRLRPPVVVRQFIATPISVTLAPQPKPRTRSRLFGYVVPARVFAPISVTLAPQPKPRTASRLRNFIVADAFVARPESIHLARITPPPVHSRLRPPAVVGPSVTYRGIQVNLTYSVRGKTMSRLSLTELQVVECYGDAMCGFDFAADVLGSDTAPTTLGTTAAGSNVRGGDVAPTVEGASAASGSVSGDDERREGC